MWRYLWRCLSVLSGIFLTLTPVLAHHEIAAKFDPDAQRILNGKVTKLDWTNPHVHILMDVEESGQVVNWAIELESKLDLERSGWDGDALNPGDAITVTGSVARNGSPQLWGNSVMLTGSGRHVLDMSPESLAALVPTPNLPVLPTPRWPDGKPRLGPAPGESGHWAKPSATVLMENGANVEMSSHGLLKNLADVDKVAPFQQWAQDLYELRQHNFLKDDPLFKYCIAPGALRQFQSPYGVQFVEDKAFERIFLMTGGGNHDWHFIYLDGRPQEGELGGSDTKPLFYGNARASWEGDTLVVDSKGFNETFWFSNGGLPHTGMLHLVERFTRTDFYTLQYEVTIEDPGAYTRPWSSSWTLEWIPDEELPTTYCEDNRP